MTRLDLQDMVAFTTLQGDTIEARVDLITSATDLLYLAEIEDEDTKELYFPLIKDALFFKNPSLIDKFLFGAALYILEENEAKLVGLAIVSEDWHVKNSFHVNELSIKKEYRGLGLGTYLLNYILNSALSTAEDAITLQCYKDDKESKETYLARENFYTGFGFDKYFDKLSQLMILRITDSPLVFLKV